MDNVQFRNNETRSCEKSLELVEELIEEEILSRLPVKSLLRFRCVSKSWHSLIGSKRFIKTHLKNSTNNQTYAHWGVIFNCIEHGLSQCSMHSYLDEERVHSSPIDDPTADHLMTTGLAVGCCDGLVCIVNVNERRFFMWNPATRISIELPVIDFDLQIMKYGFGWDEESGAYKVFVGVMYDDDHETLGKVYSSKTNSWKTVEHGCVDWYCSSGKSVCGRIHWLTMSGHIEWFDLKSEVFGRIEQPCKAEDGVELWLWVIGECLSVVRQDNTKLSVWVMEEYGVKESWVELISQPASKVTPACEHFFYPESLVSPLPQTNW